jgi:hypothetical protein
LRWRGTHILASSQGESASDVLEADVRGNLGDTASRDQLLKSARIGEGKVGEREGEEERSEEKRKVPGRT